MSSGELQGSSKCWDQRCERLSSVGSRGYHRNHDCVCLRSLGTGILTCPPPQTVIHRSSGGGRKGQSREPLEATIAGPERHELFSIYPRQLKTHSKDCASKHWVNRHGSVMSGRPRALKFMLGTLAHAGAQDLLIHLPHRS